MAKTKFVWNVAGFETLRRNAAAEARVQEEIDRIMTATGGEEAGYASSVFQGQGKGTLGRVIGTVWTKDFRAILDNSRNQTLLRALAGDALVVYTRRDGSTRLATRAQADNWGGGR